jgi:hypothetical protein
VTGYANLQTDHARDVDLLAKPFAFGDLARRVVALLSPKGGNVIHMPERLGSGPKRSWPA